MVKLISTALLAILFGQTVSGQNCGNTQVCVQQYQGTVQSGCGGVPNSENCLCQNYQAILANCFNGCSDPASMNLMNSVRSSASSYCVGAGSLSPTATLSPINNAFYANSIYGVGSSTLIVDNGPTGIAIPMHSSNGLFGYQSQATISLSPTPIRISGASFNSPKLLSSLAVVSSILAWWNL